MATPLFWFHAAHHHNKPTAAAPAPCSSKKCIYNDKSWKDKNLKLQLKKLVAHDWGLLSLTLQSFWYLLQTSLPRPPDASQGLSGGTMLWLTSADRCVLTVDRWRQ